MAEQVTQVLGIVGIKNMGEYNSQTMYEKLNVVTYNGSSYCAKQSSQGILPTDTEYWQLYAEKGEKGDTGEQGPKPVKGVDYYTADDRLAFSGEIANDVYNEVTTQIGNISNGSPLKADDISEMTNTSRVYLLTTDGYVYYYNGSSWVQGWVYQASQLEDNSVNYENLDAELQKKVNNNFIDKKFDYLLRNKYLHDVTHILTPSATGLYCLQIPCNRKHIIKIDKTTFAQQSTYRTTYSDGEDGENYLIRQIKDSVSKLSTDQIILENPYDEDNYYILILQNDDFPYCYLNLKTNVYEIPMDKISVYYLDDLLNNETNLKYASGKISNITNFNKNLLNTNLQLYGYSYWSGNTYNVGDVITTLTSPSRSSFIYLPAYTDLFVYTKSNNNYIMVYDEDLDITSYLKITDAEKIIFNNQIMYKKKLNYETNKFVIGINILGQNSYEFIASLIEISNENINQIDNKKLDNNIPIKNWYLFGDSITNKNARASINYAEWTAKDINIALHNYAVSAQGYMQGTQKFIAQLNNLTEYNPETDIITVMGSINDLSHVDNELGELGDTTSETLYGAMYVFYSTLFATYPGCRVGIISPITARTIHNNLNYKERMDLYFKALKDTANYFNIPFLDILNTGNLRPWENVFLNEYYIQDGEGGTQQIDVNGVHPNSMGHRLFYARIREFIKTL